MVFWWTSRVTGEQYFNNLWRTGLAQEVHSDRRVPVGIFRVDPCTMSEYSPRWLHRALLRRKCSGILPSRSAIGLVSVASATVFDVKSFQVVVKSSSLVSPVLPWRATRKDGFDNHGALV